MSLLGLPPVRGAVALIFLILVGTAPLPGDDLGGGERLGLLVFLLVLGTVPWVRTLSGFLRDVREPRRLEDAVVLAHRPRRLARVLSWIALGTGVLAALSLGTLLETDAPAPVVVAAVLGGALAIAVASLLPRLSRRYADDAGVVAASPDGLWVLPARGRDPLLVPWTQVGAVGESPAAAETLSPRLAEGLGPRVRWRSGAREAIARWASDGFTPTADDVRTLHLEPHWSPDPAARRRHENGRAMGLATQGGALLVAVLLGAAMVWTVGSGRAQWWWLPILGWAPLLATVILAPRVLRLLRTDPRRPAEVTAEGWVDHLHGQGLVRWERIDRIEVHDGLTLVIAREDAAPFSDRDLANRMNRRLRDAARDLPAAAQLPSAGPGFQEISPRTLPYPPRSGAFRLAREAAERGGVTVRRFP